MELRYRTFLAPRRDGKESETVGLRSVELVRRVVEQGERFAMQGWAGTPMALIVSPLGVWFVYESWLDYSPAGLAIGAVLLLWALSLWLRLIPNLSRPMLTLSKDGVDTASYGSLPWSAIEGIHVERRIKLRAESLQFYVPTLSERVSQMHPCARLRYALTLGRYRKILRFPFSIIDNRAELAKVIAEKLCHRALGMTPFWAPDDEELNRRMRALGNESRETISSLERGDLEAAHAAQLRMSVLQDEVMAHQVARSKQFRRQLTWILGTIIAIFVVLNGLYLYLLWLRG